MKSIIILSPHPDDAVLGCGGMIIKAIKEEIQVYIVFLTDGRACYTYSKIDSELTPENVAVERKKEALMSSIKLGVPKANIKFLEIWDRELNKPNNFDFALKEIKKLIVNIRPFRVFGPVFNNRHPDHQATSDIIIKAIKDYPDIEFYMYGLQRSIGKSDLKVNISDVKEQKAEAMFIHKIELVYEKDIYEILALQTKEKFRLFKLNH
ncbi:MAG: PIG-L deacetylase family protein [Candidatus Helarchaeota archaeon]